MQTARTLLALIALCAAVPVSRAAPVFPGTDAPLTWKGKHYTTSNVPLELGPMRKSAVFQWSEWAAKAGYKMEFDAQGRLLLITPANDSRTSERLKIVANAETWFDAILPPPDRSAQKKASEKAADKPDASKKPAPAPIPEDPEGPPAGATGAPGSSGQAPVKEPPQPEPPKSWGSGSIEPDSQCAVMIVVRDEKEYATLLDHLAATQPYLKDWVAIARKNTGLVVEEPLTGAYVENASGQEEWNADHELLNRVVQLLCLRRFGQQPNWIVQGIAWEGEMVFDGALYCFPYRSEFVYTTEHTAWPSEVKNLFKDRSTRPLNIAEVATWKRGTWDATAARLSWGLVHELVSLAPGKLSSLLESMRVYRDEKDRKPTGEFTWERISGWEVPAEAQLVQLKATFGPDILKTASAGLRAGSKDKSKDKTANGEKSVLKSSK